MAGGGDAVRTLRLCDLLGVRLVDDREVSP